MRIGRQALVVVVVALAGLLAVPAPAMAHNSLTGSDPEDGTSVEQAPDEVELSFLAAVDPDNAEFGVTGPDGSSVMAGDAEVDDRTVRLAVEPGPAGDYEIAWRVLSSDGDWIDGTVGFTVTVGEQAAPSPTPSPPAPSPSPTPEAVPAAEETAQDAGGSGPAWWVWVLVALVVAAAGYAGYRLTSRRRTAG
jgi:copper resistance protein C